MPHITAPGTSNYIALTASEFFFCINDCYGIK